MHDDGQMQHWSRLSKAIGLHIRDLRVERKMTQREAAATAGLNVHTWSRLERGAASNPRLETYVAVARTLGVEFPVLFSTTWTGRSGARDQLLRLLDGLGAERQAALLQAVEVLVRGPSA